MTGRFDRQIALFGEEGQAKIAATRVAVVGAGGLGTHVVQQLALLGIRRFDVIDSEELADTNRNRYVTARFDDPVPGTLKVDIAERLIRAVDPEAQVATIPDSLVSVEGFKAIIGADYVFGCLDSEGARVVLNELCAAYVRPYWDLASDVVPGTSPEYGGRVCVSTWNDYGCLVCRGLVDLDEAQRDLAGAQAKRDRDRIYGVDTAVLGRSGPSVVSINGVVSSLAVTEFMVAVSGLRPPKTVTNYYGKMGRLTTPIDPPSADCYYCLAVKGLGERADVQHYVRENVGTFLR
jgi:molybdopterin-synthase adenylyltransferase